MIAATSRLVVALIAGILFGFGLALSEMINPRRVLAFLDVFGDWDPTLLFVMLGSVPVSALAWTLVQNVSRPAIAGELHLPTRSDLDRRQLAGAVLFGVGWGIAGYCPGPAIAMLSLQWQEPLVFIVAMLLGFLLCRTFADAPPTRNDFNKSP